VPELSRPFNSTGDRSREEQEESPVLAWHKTVRFKTSALRAVVEGLILRLNLA
jgi:hypothetical protein